jgi:hypothetical protein
MAAEKSSKFSPPHGYDGQNIAREAAAGRREDAAVGKRVGGSDSNEIHK